MCNCSASLRICRFISPLELMLINLLLTPAGVHPQGSVCGKAYAKPAASNKEVDDSSSAYIQGLLAKSKESKDARTKERLDDYNRRNFKVHKDVGLLVMYKAMLCPPACTRRHTYHLPAC